MRVKGNGSHWLTALGAAASGTAEGLLASEQARRQRTQALADKLLLMNAEFEQQNKIEGAREAAAQKRLDAQQSGLNYREGVQQLGSTVRSGIDRFGRFIGDTMRNAQAAERDANTDEAQMRMERSLWSKDRPEYLDHQLARQATSMEAAAREARFGEKPSITDAQYRNQMKRAHGLRAMAYDDIASQPRKLPTLEKLVAEHGVVVDGDLYTDTRAAIAKLKELNPNARIGISKDGRPEVLDLDKVKLNQAEQKAQQTAELKAKQDAQFDKTYDEVFKALTRKRITDELKEEIVPPTPDEIRQYIQNKESVRRQIMGEPAPPAAKLGRYGEQVTRSQRIDQLILEGKAPEEIKDILRREGW